MPKIYDIKRPNVYTKNGEEKTQWLDVGSITQFDDGGLKVQMNHTSEKYLVFERKPRTDVKVDDVAF